VEVLLAFLRNKGRGQGSQLLLDMVYSNPACCDSLVPSLIHHYIAVGYVESTTEVFDKNNARSSVTSLLLDLWTWPRFRTALYDVGARDPVFGDFALAFLSDAVFLFNDSLGRLHDVKLLQQQLTDAGAADSGARHQQQEKSLRQVERAATGFLRLATVCITGLKTVVAADATVRRLFVQHPLVCTRVAQTLLNFVDKLCGPRIRDLRVANPEKLVMACDWLFRFFNPNFSFPYLGTVGIQRLC
jgi:hypothetical protein